MDIFLLLEYCERKGQTFSTLPRYRSTYTNDFQIQLRWFSISSILTHFDLHFLSPSSQAETPTTRAFSYSSFHLMMEFLTMNDTEMSPALMAGAVGKVAEISSSIHTMTPVSVLPFSSPWQLLDQLWMTVFGKHAEDFEFTPAFTTLSTWRETTAMLVIYYTVILGGREWMRNRPAFKLNTPFLIHNFYLTAISGSLLVLFLEQLIPRLWSHGLRDCICGGGGWTDKLVVLYYLNYLTKYLEFIDTGFLVLKKKPLSEFDVLL